MRTRVNDIRQMTVGIKKTRDSINLAYKNAKSPKHDAFKAILYEYLELLRKADRDRQAWIKREAAAGNTANLEEMIYGPDLDEVVRI